MVASRRRGRRPPDEEISFAQDLAYETRRGAVHTARRRLELRQANQVMPQALPPGYDPYDPRRRVSSSKSITFGDALGEDVSVENPWICINQARVHARYCTAIGWARQQEDGHLRFFHDSEVRSWGTSSYAPGAGSLVLVLSLDHQDFPARLVIRSDRVTVESLGPLHEQIVAAMSACSLAKLIASKSPEVRNQLRILFDFLEKEGL